MQLGLMLSGISMTCKIMQSPGVCCFESLLSDPKMSNLNETMLVLVISSPVELSKHIILA